MGLSVNTRSDFAMDGVAVTGQDLRMELAAALLTPAGSAVAGIGARQGVRPGPGANLAVSASSGMNLTVSAGTAWVQGTASANAGLYTACLDTTSTITVAASDPTNPRIDNVIVQITDVGTSSSTSVVTMQTGTPAGSPVAPTLPANSLLLATVAVAASTTTITSGNITDKRVYTSALGGIVPIQDTSGGLVGPAGTFAYDINTSRLKIADGSGNARAVKTVAFAPVSTVVSSPVTAAAGSPGAASTVASVSVTTDGSTEIEIKALFSGYYQTTPHVGDALTNQLLVDGSGVGNTYQWFWMQTQSTNVGNQYGGGSFSQFVTLAAGSHTISWTITAGPATNSITLWAANQACATLRVSAVPG